VYLIVPDNATVGQTVTSAAIRNNPNYAGGLIGFVLMKGTLRVYYSEYMRNAYCSQCVQPGYWKMMLVYQSNLLANTFYLAFEDWEGADARSWGRNDGDFNDKVFRVEGLLCGGGGAPCDTGQVGICAVGTMQCQKGQLTCVAAQQPQPDVCNGVDDDCNGVIDDGTSLCPAGELCDRGVCVAPCGGGEFVCTGADVCNSLGLCVDPLCKNVSCLANQVCKAGLCGDGCGGVTCPYNQRCLLGRCADLCAGLVCDPGYVCSGGVCQSCNCEGCASGLGCVNNVCTEPACQGVTCAAAEHCEAGNCIDNCAGVVCPNGDSCTGGQCPNSVSSGTGGSPILIGPDGGVIVAGSGGTGQTMLPDGAVVTGNGGATFVSGGTSGVGAATSGGSSNSSGAASNQRVSSDEKASCGCRVAGSTSGTRRNLFALLALVVGVSGRRRARRGN
jgi:MYXO-CTERM domain-containing protein